MLTAVETSIRDHTNELAAKKLLLQQVVDATTQDGIDKKKSEERLDVSFTQHNQKHADHEKNMEAADMKSKMVMSTVNAMAATVAKRLDELAHEFKQWKQSQTSQRRRTPPTPSSWGGPGQKSNTGGF